MSSRTSNLLLKDISAANSLGAEGYCPDSTTHLKGIKGHEIKSFWSLVHLGLQGFCNQVLHKAMQKFQESIWYLDLSKADSSPAMRKGIFFSQKDLSSLQKQGLGWNEAFWLPVLLEGDQAPGISAEAFHRGSSGTRQTGKCFIIGH